MAGRGDFEGGAEGAEPAGWRDIEGTVNGRLEVGRGAGDEPGGCYRSDDPEPDGGSGKGDDGGVAEGREGDRRGHGKLPGEAAHGNRMLAGGLPGCDGTGIGRAFEAGSEERAELDKAAAERPARFPFRSGGDAGIEANVDAGKRGVVTCPERGEQGRELLALERLADVEREELADVFGAGHGGLVDQRFEAMAVRVAPNRQGRIGEIERPEERLEGAGPWFNGAGERIHRCRPIKRGSSAGPSAARPRVRRRPARHRP